MIGRAQLPVSSPIAVRALCRAVIPTITGDESNHDALERELLARLGARRVRLTDSGTSALVLALRLAAGKGGTVAFPGYACIDLAAAALLAGVRVRLYDLEPTTLGPDLGSLERTLRRGADAVLVAHLYGYPVAMPDVAALAAAYGVPVIEDAAQAAGATLAHRPLGSFGDLAVLSFGRGKGTAGGSGGALVSNNDRFDTQLTALDDYAATAGWRDLVAATAQFLFGRPSLYALPRAIPQLRLGEMVFKPAHEPLGMSRAAASLVQDAIARGAEETAARRANAARLTEVASCSRMLETVMLVDGAAPGFLRLPLRDFGRREAAPLLGVMRGYPLALDEQPPLQRALHPGEPATPGSRELRRTLFTIPTHSMLSERDHDAIAGWMRGPFGAARLQALPARGPLSRSSAR